MYITSTRIGTPPDISAKIKQLTHVVTQRTVVPWAPGEAIHTWKDPIPFSKL